EKLNALSPELIDEITEVLNKVAADDTVRAAVITGAGRSFSAGGDVMKDIVPLKDKSPVEFNAYVDQAVKMYKAAHEMEKPIIAAINGYAVGAGLELALSCDIRVAADDAKMGEAFVRMGLMPEMSVYVLPRLIGMGKAKLMSFTGDTVTAQDAERMGLVDMVAPSGEMLSAAQSLAKKLAEGPVAIGVIKKALNEALGMSMDMSLHYAMRMQYHLVHTEDHKEAIAAWMEKRKPVFKGK
ncbi:MAG: enoyl-CoA hydratase-related protein, partial [Dehalococcoidia bacterium]|nr:enoyl-CoA hydratase-related protein [Dehalococcoidia bacterium]